jgi:hypothetical protein
MFTAVLILLTSTAGGLAATYLYDEDSPILMRLAAGVVIGMTFFGFAAALLSFAFGLNTSSVLIAALVSGLPLAAFRQKEHFDRFQDDLADLRNVAGEIFTKFELARIFALIAYTALFAMLWFFFKRAMLEMLDGGIGTGAANNLGDLPFHLLVINGFTMGQEFPPDNPIFSGATLSYPFITDLIAAAYNIAGATVHDALFLQNIVLIVAVVGLMAGFTLKVTKSVFAAGISPFLLVFAGGLGFLLFFGDAVTSDAGIVGQLFKLNADYTLRGGTIWRWGNPLTTLFITQRTLLLGLPIALIIFTRLFTFLEQKQDRSKRESNTVASILGGTSRPFLIVGLLAGLLPLIHSHTFLVTVAVSGLLALADWRKWRFWAIFFIGVAITAVPQIVFIMSSTATAAGSFVGWDIGWDNGDNNAVWFWLVNTGLFIPLLLIALFLLTTRAIGDSFEDSDRSFDANSNAKRMLVFFVPFLLCFAGANVLRLAPWVWDNVKVLIYCYVGAIPLVAWLLAEIRNGSSISYVLLPALIIMLMFAGWLDVWRVATGQIEHQILSPQMMAAARNLSSKMPKDSLIVTAPEFATIPVLTGSRWFLGYTGHVWSHGIAGNERDAIVRKIYAGGEESVRLIKENNIDYVVVGPQEKQFTKVNEAFFQSYPIEAEAGDFRVFRVGDGTDTAK